MWINPMLTLFLWSTVLGLALVLGCLWFWYLRPGVNREQNSDSHRDRDSQHDDR